MLYNTISNFDIEVKWRKTIVNLRLVHASPAMCMSCQSFCFLIDDHSKMKCCLKKKKRLCACTVEYRVSALGA